MAATETRLLLLGSVMIFEPVNGYQIRRELLSWNVQDWAHVNPGSIYSGLATLTRRGDLDRHDLVDGGREVAVYTTTARGREAFSTMWREATETVDLLTPLAFHTALALMSLVTREDAAEAVNVRLAHLDAELRGHVERAGGDVAPPHVRAMADLWAGLASTEREWLADLRRRIRAGELDFRGEPERWAPPADDPGWAIARDRERYLSLITARR
ncbi:PadR family transcriptional regulator [Phycicoccus sp. CSK15P-2]|uniref:PadR family transcriptional regulator n=1 Tax=Phycicoccus sp. CSK15P-2 TaxID=2807627 RepID=UPI00194E9FEB|nr:PadR family transcriptional regulator [Phycicoccus sp. CSK15P-2]MBM6403104.1 PadR family transcriptional regulator [Phycicoccus sp. CSK15P-2]